MTLHVYPLADQGHYRRGRPPEVPRRAPKRAAIASLGVEREELRHKVVRACMRAFSRHTHIGS